MGFDIRGATDRTLGRAALSVDSFEPADCEGVQKGDTPECGCPETASAVCLTAIPIHGSVQQARVWQIKANGRVPRRPARSAKHEDAGGDKGEGERDAGGEQHVFLREIGRSVGASDAIRSVGCGLEFHIVFPLMRRICDASPMPLW